MRLAHRHFLLWWSEGKAITQQPTSFQVVIQVGLIAHANGAGEGRSEFSHPCLRAAV